MSFLGSLASKGLHVASHALSNKGGARFRSACRSVEESQLSILQGILESVSGTESAAKYHLRENSSLSEFQTLPISDYDVWHEQIERQQAGRENVLSNIKCERYQPTSGSTSRMKWIPYNQAFLDELDQAISPWMADLYRQFPEIKQGKHYWSLSWVPSDLRNKLTSSINDDLQLLPWWKRLFMSGTMAVPEAISLANTSEESSIATACYLVACRDLSFISVWSPTFALSLLQLIKDKQPLIVEVLNSGQWPETLSGLSHLSAPKSPDAAKSLDAWDGELSAKMTSMLWPKLGLISAWDTSSSKIWANKLRDLFPHCRFQGKGLWATEGVISFPFQGKYPLALTSHFYEFEDLDTNQIHTSWQLTEGQNVRPILSSSNGLLRYAMNDQLKVTGFLDQCPCFEFIGRLSGVDMVGEKLSPELAVNIINEFSMHDAILPISLLALPSYSEANLPRYALLCENQATYNRLNTCEQKNLQVELDRELEEFLLQNFHYKLARELGQLDHAHVLLMEDAMQVYTSHKIARGMVAGNVKIEPLVLWQNELFSPQCSSASNEQQNRVEAVS